VCKSGTALDHQPHICQGAIAMKAEMHMFENYQIRRVYDEDTEIWWFSVIDIVQVLTQQADYQTARKYWNKLKERLIK
jgi:DNA-damage-inducible protein D